MRHEKVIDSKPVAIYNCYNQELIGVFSSGGFASRYLFEQNKMEGASRIWTSIKTKHKISKGTIFDFPVVCRNANNENKDILGNSEYVILNGYQTHSGEKMKGFKQDLFRDQIKDRDLRNGTGNQKEELVIPKDAIEFNYPIEDYKEDNKKASYTTTYKEDLQGLIKKLNDEVKFGNMNVYTLLQNARKELISLNQYNIQSFQCITKTYRKNIANQLKSSWKPKVTHIESSAIIPFTSMKYKNLQNNL